MERAKTATGLQEIRYLAPTKRDFCQRFVLDHQRNLFQWTPGSQGGNSLSVDPWVLDRTGDIFSALSANDILGVGSFSPSTFGRTKTVCLCRCQLDRAFNEMAGLFILFGLYEIFEPQCLYHVGGLEEWSDDRTIDIWPLLVISSSWIAGSFASSSFRCTHANLSYLRCKCGFSTSARNHH